MRACIYILILFSASFVSCTKDGATNNAANSNNNVGTGGSLARFIIVNNYLYIADATGVIKIFDITNNGLPDEKTSVHVGGAVETIFSYDNNLFIGSATGMFIYSLADPAKPSLTGQAQHLRSCDPVVANSAYAYVTLRSGTPCGTATDGLYTYNITNVINPVLVSTLEMSTPSGLALNDSFVYVCRKTNGLSVVNVSDAMKPAMIKTIEEADFEDVIVYDKLLICYVTTGIRLYDISAADNPVYISSVANE